MISRCLLLVSLLVIRIFVQTAQADPRAGYYDEARLKVGTNLFAVLHAIISRGTTNIPYSSSSKFDTADALKWIDENPADTNEVILFYSGLTASKSTFGLTSGWNREHCWANSYGLDGVEPSFSDLHNLHAIDANVNSSRNNKVYDESSASDGTVTFPAHAEAPGCSADPNSWQPADFHVGDSARTILYMATRYWGDRLNEPALFLTEDPNAVNSTTNLMGKLSTLIYWHALDPVSDSERLRNDRVEAFQGNRNPYVDHPEYVAVIWGDITTLHMVKTNQTLTLSWTNSLRRAVLESSASVTGQWNQTVSGTNRFTMGSTNQAQFFRLRLK